MMLIGALEEWMDEKPKAQDLLFTVDPLQEPGFLLHSGSNFSGDSFLGRVIVYGPTSPPPFCPLHATHRRASGAVGRDLILLRAALLLSHGAKAILHSPEQHGVQVSIFTRGHLND